MDNERRNFERVELNSNDAIRAHPKLLVRFRVRLVRLLQVVVPPFLQFEILLRAYDDIGSESGRARRRNSHELTSELFLEHCGRRSWVSQTDLGARQLALLTIDLGMSFASDRVALSFEDRDALGERGAIGFSCHRPLFPARHVAKYLLGVFGDQSLKRRFLLDLSTRETVSCGARTIWATSPRLAW